MYIITDKIDFLRLLDRWSSNNFALTNPVIVMNIYCTQINRLISLHTQLDIFGVWSICTLYIYLHKYKHINTYITSLMQTFLKDHISHIGTFLYILVCHILLYQWMWNCKLGMYILLDYDLNMLEIGKYTTILKNNTRHLSTNNIISYFWCSTQSLTTPSWPLLCLFVVREFQRNLDFFPLTTKYIKVAPRTSLLLLVPT